MVEKILASPESWKLVEFSEESLQESLRLTPPTFPAELAFSKI
jgi:UDP-3-O-[3-hydroxymyristoyl] N-acetylglucosamine deacetylase